MGFDYAVLLGADYESDDLLILGLDCSTFIFL